MEKFNKFLVRLTILIILFLILTTAGFLLPFAFNLILVLILFLILFKYYDKIENSFGKFFKLW